MKRRWLALAALFFFLVTFIFVLRLPASQGLHWVLEQTASKFQWESVSGTVFDGEVEGLSLILHEGQPVYLNRLEFKTSILSLLLARLELEIKVEAYDGDLNGRVELGSEHWKISDLKGDISFSVLPVLMPDLEDLDIRGRVRIIGDLLSGDYRLINTAEAELFLKDLKVGLFEHPGTLGDYAFTFTTEQQKEIVGDISTTKDSSALMFVGGVELMPEERQLKIDALAWTTANAPESIESLLPLMGELKGGRAEVDWKIKF